MNSGTMSKLMKYHESLVRKLLVKLVVGSSSLVCEVRVKLLM